MTFWGFSGIYVAPTAPSPQHYLSAMVSVHRPAHAPRKAAVKVRIPFGGSQTRRSTAPYTTNDEPSPLWAPPPSFRNVVEMGTQIASAGLQPSFFSEPFLTSLSHVPVV